MSFMSLFLIVASLAPAAMILYIWGVFVDKEKVESIGRRMAVLVLIALKILAFAYYFRGLVGR